MSFNIKGSMGKENMGALWSLYKSYCRYASVTQDVKAESAPDFLGWLERFWDDTYLQDQIMKYDN